MPKRGRIRDVAGAGKTFTANKDHSVIVDAAGVTRSKKPDTRALGRKPTVSLNELMMNAALGARDEDTLTSLDSRNAGTAHFADEQMEWLRLIKDRIAASLSVVPEGLDLSPFDRKGGLGQFYKVFGEDSFKRLKIPLFCVILENNAQITALAETHRFLRRWSLFWERRKGAYKTNDLYKKITFNCFTNI